MHPDAQAERMQWWNGRGWWWWYHFWKITPSAWIICLFLAAVSQREKLGLRCIYQLNQKALHIQCLWSAHEFSTSANVLRPVCHKWDYPVCHFATSDIVKHRQGLSKLWGHDENFTTVMSVIHCVFTGKQLWISVSWGNTAPTVLYQSFPAASNNLMFSLKIKSNGRQRA